MNYSRKATIPLGPRFESGRPDYMKVMSCSGFGIDWLWAQRQLRLEEGDALAALQAEFTGNPTAIERVLAFHT